MLHSNKEAAEALLRAGADANALYDGRRDGLRYYPVAPIHYAAMNLDVATALKLLDAGADPEYPARDERDELYDAIRLACVFGSALDSCAALFVRALKRARRKKR